jgi:hypothetical protein
MDDMNDENLKTFVASKVRELTEAHPGRIDDIFHYLRAQVV